MAKLKSPKLECPVCHKKIDPRAFKIHVNSHSDKSIPEQGITVNAYRQGYRDGWQDAISGSLSRSKTGGQ